MRRFSPKAPGESVVLTFDFTWDLVSGEKLTGIPNVVVTLASGVTDINMMSMVVEPPQLNGNYVLQMCTAGVLNNEYSVEATCNTSANRVLTIGGILPIVKASLQ